MKNESGWPQLVAFVLTAFLAGAVAAHAQEVNAVAVVAHPSVPVDNLTFQQMRNLLLGDRQFWSADLKVTLLIRAPVARERDIVLKTIYEMTEAQFRRYWISKVFRAQAAAGPKIVYSNSMATALAQSLPGALTFVAASDVPEGLKVIRIDGFLPGEEGYPLKD